MTRSIVAAALAVLGFGVGIVQAADKEQARTQETQRTQAQEQVYGSQLMTQKERDEYRSKMRAAKTDEEREQLRGQHHEQMKLRAKEKGVTLPDEPPPRQGQGGMGPGMGQGMGPGMGQGRGAGSGRGTGGMSGMGGMSGTNPGAGASQGSRQ